MFLLYALNHNHAHSHAHRYAADEIKLDANLDELPEIEDGLKELEQAAQVGSARSGPYWSKIRAKILSTSSTQDVEEALKEWSRNGAAWVDPTVSGTCELCGKHPIKFHFPIKNRVTGSSLVVGSECIFNYLQIPGFGSMEELRRRLNGERNRLKKKELGQISDTELALSQEATELEAQLRERFSHLAAGEPDFNVKEYRYTLSDVHQVIQGVNPKATILASITQTQRDCYGFIRVFNTLTKRVKNLKEPGLIAMVSAVMRLRDFGLKLSLLKQLQAAANDMLKAGYPSDFIKRCWDTVKDEKAALLERLDKSVDDQTSLLRAYDSALDQLKPYEFLHFSLSAGINIARKLVMKQADEAKALVMQDDFIEIIQKKDNPISAVLTAYGINPMSRFPEQMVEQALALASVPNQMAWVMGSISQAVQRKYGLARVTDQAGVKVACFRALDDGLVDFWERGVPNKLIALVESDNAKFDEILKQEVDDVKALKKRELWEMLSERWDFDLQKALKVFSPDGDFEEGFARSLIRNWERWPKLSPKQMAIIQKKLAKRDKELPDNMWNVLKSELTRPAPIG